MNELRDVKTLILIALVINYFIVAGADIFGQAAIAWTVLDAPPRSLDMFQAAYVYESAPFWRVTTTLLLVLIVAALIANWKTPRRRLLLITLVGYVVINAVSFAFILPEYGALVSSEFSDTVDLTLQARAATWEWVAFARWAVFTALGVLPLLALARPTAAQVQQEPEPTA